MQHSFPCISMFFTYDTNVKYKQLLEKNYNK